MCVCVLLCCVCLYVCCVGQGPVMLRREYDESICVCVCLCVQSYRKVKHESTLRHLLTLYKQNRLTKQQLASLYGLSLDPSSLPPPPPHTDTHTGATTAAAHGDSDTETHTHTGAPPHTATTLSHAESHTETDTHNDRDVHTEAYTAEDYVPVEGVGPAPEESHTNTYDDWELELATPHTHTHFTHDDYANWGVHDDEFSQAGYGDGNGGGGGGWGGGIRGLTWQQVECALGEVVGSGPKREAREKRVCRVVCVLRERCVEEMAVQDSVDPDLVTLQV